MLYLITSLAAPHIDNNTDTIRLQNDTRSWSTSVARARVTRLYRRRPPCLRHEPAPAIAVPRAVAASSTTCCRRAACAATDLPAADLRCTAPCGYRLATRLWRRLLVPCCRCATATVTAAAAAGRKNARPAAGAMSTPSAGCMHVQAVGAASAGMTSNKSVTLSAVEYPA